MLRNLTVIFFCLAIIVFAAILPACKRVDDPSQQNVKEVQSYRYHSEVQEVTLKDGTRCVVMAGSEGRGGITCDWR